MGTGGTTQICANNPRNSGKRCSTLVAQAPLQMSSRNEQATQHTPLEAVNIALAYLEQIAMVFNKMNNAPVVIEGNPLDWYKVCSKITYSCSSESESCHLYSRYLISKGESQGIPCHITDGSWFPGNPCIKYFGRTTILISTTPVCWQPVVNESGDHHSEHGSENVD